MDRFIRDFRWRGKAGKGNIWVCVKGAGAKVGLTTYEEMYRLWPRAGGSGGLKLESAVRGLRYIRRVTAFDHEQHDPSHMLARYAELLETHFPRAVPDTAFIEHVSRVLNKHRFRPDSSINLISTCRDEICRPFTKQIESAWGQCFDLSSLGGFSFCGKTAFKAAMAHAPIVDGIERYVIWVAPHIGLTLEGEFGKVYRPGRAAPSSACGAVILLHNELKSTKLRVNMDPIDMEQSTLKQMLVNNIPYGTVPSLVDLTYKVYETILEEAQLITQSAVNPKTCEYVIIAGIQIHGPIGQSFEGVKPIDFFWPGEIVKIVGDERVDLYEEYAASVAMGSHVENSAHQLNGILAELQLRQRNTRIAAIKGDISTLSSAGINLSSVMDHHRRTLLHVATAHGQTEVVRFLLNLHPSLISAEDISGNTPMDLAVDSEHEAVADVLYEHGGVLSGERLSKRLVGAVNSIDAVKFNRFSKYVNDCKACLTACRDEEGRSLMHICLLLKKGLDTAKAEQWRQIHDALVALGVQENPDDIDCFGHTPAMDVDKKDKLAPQSTGAAVKKPAAPSPQPKATYSKTSSSLDVRTLKTQPLPSSRNHPVAIQAAANASRRKEVVEPSEYLSGAFCTYSEITEPPELLDLGSDALDKPSKPTSETFCAYEAHDQQHSLRSLARYAQLLENHFPRALPDDVFISNVSDVLNKHGFTPKTAINLVSTCRDEICRPFSVQIQKRWGNVFNVSSLAGFSFCGKTGFKAAMAHAPIVDGIERYVIWVATHIGLTLEGEFGKVYRPGRAAPSSACGALILLHNELKSSKIRVSLDPIDMEQSLLKQSMVNNLPYGHVPTLVELTYKVYDTILQDVRSILNAVVDHSNCEFVIVGGIQIHGPVGLGFDGSSSKDFFWPGEIIKVSGGETHDLYEEYAAEVAKSLSTTRKKSTWNVDNVLAYLQLRRRNIRLAAMTGNIAELRAAGIGLSTVNDHHQRTLLHIAAQHGQLEVAKFLITLHPKLVEAEDIAGHTAMDLALQGGHEEVADFLADKGGGLFGKKLQDALIQAVKKLDVKQFRLLLKHSIDGNEAVNNARDEDGKSLLHICVSMRSGLQKHQIEAYSFLHDELERCGAVGVDSRRFQNFWTSFRRFSAF